MSEKQWLLEPVSGHQLGWSCVL